MRYNVLVYEKFYFLRNVLGHKSPYVGKMDRMFCVRRFEIASANFKLLYV